MNKSASDTLARLWADDLRAKDAEIKRLAYLLRAEQLRRESAIEHIKTLVECIQTDPTCKYDYTYQVKDAEEFIGSCSKDMNNG